MDYLIFATVLFVPLILIPSLLLVWVYRAPRAGWPDTILHYTVGDTRIALTPRARRLVIGWLTILVVVSMFAGYVLPFADVLLLLLLTFVLTRTLRAREVAIKASTREVLDALPQVTKAIPALAPHVEMVANELTLRRSEIEDKERISKELESQVTAASKRLDSLKALTTDQRKEVLLAARDTLARRGWLAGVATAIGSVFLNVLATLIWALLDTPGKGRVQEFFASLAGRL